MMMHSKIIIIITFIIAITSSSSSSSSSKESSFGYEVLAHYSHLIHQQQHPSLASCYHRRLLVLDLHTPALEGWFGLTKLIVTALSTALHMNRTLVWGFNESQFVFEATKDVWCNDDNNCGDNLKRRYRRRKKISLGGIDVSCPLSYSDDSINDENVDISLLKQSLGGPFACFYESLSTCDIRQHASPFELRQLYQQPFQHEARVAILDVSMNSASSISLYYPPFGWDKEIKERYWNHDRYRNEDGKNTRNDKDNVGDKGRDDSGSSKRHHDHSTDVGGLYSKLYQKYKGHYFTAAISSYVFRLQPNIKKQLDRRYHQLTLHSFRNRKQNSNEDADVDAMDDGSEDDANYVRNGDRKKLTWGLHIRHGDVKSFHKAIRHKRIFTIDSYFKKARDLSHAQKQSPGLLYVSTDSIQADLIPSIFAKFERQKELSKPSSSSNENMLTGVMFDELSDREESISSQYSHWYQSESPNIYVVNNTNRYRTEHGFVVAATNRCVNYQRYKYCDIPMQFAVPVDNYVYGGTESVLQNSRSLRLMRLFMEAIEDVYFLSLADTIIATSSSHFSTMAVFLMWARTGCADLDHSYRFLDEDTAITGDSASAFLQATNLWNSSYTGPGPERWRIHTFRFISGLPGPTYQESINSRAVYKARLTYDPWSPEMRMRFINDLPLLPEKVLYRETALWRADPKAKPWPGSCVSSRDILALSLSPEEIDTIIMDYINLGIEHYSSLHIYAASACWLNAAKVLGAYENFLPQEVKANMYFVLSGNLGSLHQAATKYLTLSRLLEAKAVRYEYHHVKDYPTTTSSANIRPNREDDIALNTIISSTLEDIIAGISRMEDQFASLAEELFAILEA